MCVCDYLPLVRLEWSVFYLVICCPESPSSFRPFLVFLIQNCTLSVALNKRPLVYLGH